MHPSPLGDRASPGRAESHPLPLSSALHTVGAQQTHIEETDERMHEANAESKLRFKVQHSRVSPPREPIEIVPVFLLTSDVSILRCRCSEPLSASTKWGYWQKGCTLHLPRGVFPGLSELTLWSMGTMLGTEQR